MKCLKFAQIFPKALKYTNLSTFEKGQKMAKRPNHFISGKQFQKGQMATLVVTSVAELFSNSLIYFISLQIGHFLIKGHKYI